MSAWIERLVIPLLLMIIGGIGTVAWQYISAQEISYVTADMKFVETPNPFYGADSRQLADLEKAVSVVTGFAASALPFRAEKFSRVAVITFRNFSNVRSKEVELIARDDSILYSTASLDPKRAVMGRRIKLQPIDPMETSVVYAVVSGWPYSVPANISAVHDNKKLNIFSNESEDVANTFAAAVAQFPMIVTALLFAGALTIIILCISIPLQIAQAVSPKFRYWLITDALLKQHLEVIRRVEEDHPERIAKLRAPTVQA
ncbi:hypothetical protein [Rhodopseudomonas palustris]